MLNFLAKLQFKKIIDRHFDFRPDLIVEATNACNRSCPGCYAPNILVTKDSHTSTALFLNPAVLNLTLNEIGGVNMLAIRGGEPSVHPSLGEILEVARIHSDIVVLETHGRWIKSNNSLLKVCKESGIFIKISFDSMHRLSASELFDVHSILQENSIKYLVAITESSYADFLKSRALCSWVGDNQIIYQKKAVRMDALIKPRIGVVKVDGRLVSTLSTKKSFLIDVQHA